MQFANHQWKCSYENFSDNIIKTSIGQRSIWSNSIDDYKNIPY